MSRRRNSSRGCLRPTCGPRKFSPRPNSRLPTRRCSSSSPAGTGDYAIIGLAGTRGRLPEEIRFSRCRSGAGVRESASNSESLAEAKQALGEDLDPPADLYHSSATKLHLAKVLLERAWNTL